MAILVTTSLRPSQRTRTLCNELKASCAAFSSFTRGKFSHSYLMEYARAKGASRLWVINSRFGGPKLIECFDLRGEEPCASFLLNHVQLLREMSIKSPKSTRHRQLVLIPPESSALQPIFESIRLATGECEAGRAASGKFTELHIQPSRGLVELFLIDSVTKLPCGPALYIKAFRKAGCDL
ncbi:MAG: hypothetical protein QFX35_03290 [Candidatus Verstraetearchaeota archaeon]|nr:hypothetical protein [Candidatus Verstraetearchaeota archaeon]